MISANEAYKQSVERKFLLEKISFSNIELLIENAINQGEFSIIYEGMMFISLKQKLIEQGYEVRIINRPNKFVWEISWEEAKEAKEE